MIKRRQFFKTAAMSSAAALCIPEIVLRAMPASRQQTKIELQTGDVILFQGDSITDAGRHKDEKDPNKAHGLGSGYGMLASGHMLKMYADKSLNIFNRGVGGDKVFQLQERWKVDCLDLKPNIVSIHIGVNDFWHTLTSKYTGTVEVYESDYRALLTQTQAELPNVKFIIGEPFALSGTKVIKEKWFPAFEAYQSIAAKLAVVFGAIFIPYQKVFTEAQQFAPASYWTEDGVHPTLAGSQLMAEAWLAAIQ